MPRIPTVILNSIVYLYPDRDHAQNGSETGASGFLLAERSAVSGGIRPVVQNNPSLVDQVRKELMDDFRVAHESGDRQKAKTIANANAEVRRHIEQCDHIYIVTNKHVIEGQPNCPVVRMNLRNPGDDFERTIVLDFKQADWVTDPANDLAVCMLPPDFNTPLAEFSVITRDFLLTRKQFVEEDIGPGDDVVYVGRFAGHAGKYENMPSVRFGNISMNPNEREPITYDIDNHTRTSQVGFLVEARSRSGYSGSPVFTLNQHAVNNRRAVLPMMDMRLLGVDWGHVPEQVRLLDFRGYPLQEGHMVQVHAGMMGVVPAWCLLDLIDSSPRLIEQRMKDDAWYAGHPASDA